MQISHLQTIFFILSELFVRVHQNLLLPLNAGASRQFAQIYTVILCALSLLFAFFILSFLSFIFIARTYKHTHTFESIGICNWANTHTHTEIFRQIVANRPAI